MTTLSTTPGGTTDRAIVGIFDDRLAAEEAVHTLHQAGFGEVLAAAAAGLGVEQVHGRRTQQRAAEKGHRVFSLVSHRELLPCRF